MSTYAWSYAPTDRATCKGKCGQKIAKGAVRLGISADNGHHTMVSYRNLGCVTDKQIANIIAKVGSLEAVDGFDGLADDDQKAVLAKDPSVASSAAASSSKPAGKAKAARAPKAKPAARAPKAKPAPKRKAAPPMDMQHKFLDEAKEYKFDAIKDMLQSEPELVNVQPMGRWSALHQFAAAGNVDAVRFLLENGADRKAKTKDGKTPREVAAPAVVEVFDEPMEEEEEEEAEEEEPEPAKGTKRSASASAASPKKVARTASASSPAKASASSPAKKAKTAIPVDSAVPNKDQYSVVDDWSVLLNQTNVGANNNKYYRIQLLSSGASYYCWTHWGRVGSSGDSALNMFASQEGAEKEFKAKFRTKSGVPYEDKDAHDWKPTAGKYTLVQTEEQEGAGGDGSAPLGKLTEEQIGKGQAVLLRIDELLPKKNVKQLQDASSEYYTLIPHNFGFKVPPAITSREMLEAEEELLKFYLRMGFEELEQEDDGLTPISGIMTMDLPKSLDSACSKLCSAKEIKSSNERGKKHGEKQSGGPSKPMDSHLYAAIMLYTSNAIYRNLNSVLRSEDRGKIQKYFAYLRLLLEALGRLPQQSRTLWRGVGVDLYDKYKKGSTVTWWGVSSCTSDLQVAKNFMSGCGGKCTLLTIKTKTAADISEITFFGNEKESLLAPGMQLKVVSSSRTGNKTEITLEEVGRVLD